VTKSKGVRTSRPWKHEDPEAVKARRSLLVRVRNRAHAILAARHPEEFADIKDELLVKMGEPPVDRTYVTRKPDDTMEVR
jgi:hypothetical protein